MQDIMWLTCSHIVSQLPYVRICLLCRATVTSKTLLTLILSLYEWKKFEECLRSAIYQFLLYGRSRKKSLDNEALHVLHRLLSIGLFGYCSRCNLFIVKQALSMSNISFVVRATMESQIEAFTFTLSPIKSQLSKRSIFSSLMGQSHFSNITRISDISHSLYKNL